MLIAHMTDGFSFESFAAKINKNRDSLYEWAKRHPEFSDAKKKGTDQSLLWWEDMGRRGMTGQLARLKKTIEHKDGKIEKEYDRAVFGQSTWIFNMKNRHNWRDKTEISGPDGGPLELTTSQREEMISNPETIKLAEALTKIMNDARSDD